MGTEPTIEQGRFEIGRRLGEGASALVYEAYDRLRKRKVALKSLRDLEASHLYRFKREFRALADLSHPNLVGLYELIELDGRWFLAMELIDGVNFLRYVCGVGDQPDLTPSAVDRSSTTADIGGEMFAVGTAEGVAGAVGETGARRAPAADLALLRPALYQLASAIKTLHESGHVHSDLKPSNILVTPSGRVVVLDFGIIVDLTKGGELRRKMVAGTPAYMAPEQLDPRAEPTEASDWYAFGTMIYEALTGGRPFTGAPTLVAAMKRRGAVAPRVEEQAPAAPADLAHLAEALLAHDPAVRPSGAEVLQILRPGAPDEPARPEIRPDRAAASAFAGREPELMALRAALDKARGRQSAAVLVSGKSGIGKTALVEQFLRELPDDIVILRGRCYERESLPYKALDSLVDAVTDYLHAQPPGVIESILPEDIGALGRVFPVLCTAREIGERTRRMADDAAVAALQRRGFAALRDLLARIGASVPLVIFIDDLHWGDGDSAPFIVDLIAPTNTAVLFIGGHRTVDSPGNPLVQRLTDAVDRLPGERGVRLVLAELSTAELVSIAEVLLGHRARRASLAGRIAVEARGSPYFAAELTRHVQHEGSVAAGTSSLDSLIVRRVDALSDAAQRLLEVVCVAAFKITRELARKAARLDPDEERVFLELVGGNFVRTAGAGDQDAVEPYHDRIREAVSGSLSGAEERRLHRAIAHALEDDAKRGPEQLYALAHHYYHARSPADAERTFRLCADAGRAALASYAYERAQAYFEQAELVAEQAAIELSSDFLHRYANACARTGRVHRAAENQSRALARTDDPLQRAVAHTLMSKIRLGQLDIVATRSEAALALHQLGAGLPEKRVGHFVRTLLAFVRGLATLASRSRFGSARDRERDELHAVVELYNHLGVVAYFDMDRSTMVQVLLRQLHPVARLGSSSELALWYALAATVAAIAGKRRLCRRLLRAALATAETIRDPSTTGRVRLYEALGDNFLGETELATRHMCECLERHGGVLENADFLTGIADLAWNLMMRGHAVEGWAWINRGLDRAALEGGRSRLTEGHTYRCYAGPLLAMLGRVADGARHLDEFRSLIETVGDQGWRRAQYLAHQLLYYVEIDELGESFEAVLAQHRAMDIGARKMPQQLKHVHVAHAYARLRLFERAPVEQKRCAERELTGAIHDLGRAGKHPTLRAHHDVICAGFAVARQRWREFERFATRAERLARATDNPWVHFELAHIRARAAAARGDHGSAARYLEEARNLAHEYHWSRREQR